MYGIIQYKYEDDYSSVDYNSSAYLPLEYYEDYVGGNGNGNGNGLDFGSVCLCEVCLERPEWRPPDYEPMSRYLWHSGLQASPETLAGAIKDGGSGGREEVSAKLSVLLSFALQYHTIVLVVTLTEQ